MISSFMFFLFRRLFTFFCLVQQKAAKCLYDLFVFPTKFFRYSNYTVLLQISHQDSGRRLSGLRSLCLILYFDLFSFSNESYFVVLSSWAYQILLIQTCYDLIIAAGNFFEYDSPFSVPGAFHILFVFQKAAKCL